MPLRCITLCFLVLFPHSRVDQFLVAGSGCYSLNINSGQRFALLNVYSQRFLSARQDPDQNSSFVVQEDTLPSDPNVQLVYIFKLMHNSGQIFSPTTNLCLDDLNNGYSAADSTSNNLAFRSCTGSSNQEFAHSPESLWLINPTNPYNKCLDGNYAFPYIFLYTCPEGASDHQWIIVQVCSPGTQ